MTDQDDKVTENGGHLDVVGQVPAPELKPVASDVSLEDLFNNVEYQKDSIAAQPWKTYDPSIPASPYNSPWRDPSSKPEINHKHKFIAHLAALGMSAVEISERSSYGTMWLSTLMRHPEFQKIIDQTRKEIFGESLEQQLKLSLPAAVKVVHGVLTDPNEKSALRVDAAFRLMDRTHGKPNQRVEHTGSLLKDLFAELDSREDEKPTIDIDAEWSDASKTDPEETDTDPVSEFIKNTYEQKD